MSALFSSPPKPAPPTPAPPPPTLADPAVQQAAQDQANAAAQAAGRASTVLTSGLGDTSTPSIGKKTLLGA